MEMDAGGAGVKLGDGRARNFRPGPAATARRQFKTGVAATISSGLVKELKSVD
jgi:hypothetical protein